jgi:hypothetical protein
MKVNNVKNVLLKIVKYVILKVLVKKQNLDFLLLKEMLSLALQKIVIFAMMINAQVVLKVIRNLKT